MKISTKYDDGVDCDVRLFDSRYIARVKFKSESDEKVDDIEIIIACLFIT